MEEIQKKSTPFGDLAKIYGYKVIDNVTGEVVNSESWENERTAALEGKIDFNNLFIKLIDFPGAVSPRSVYLQANKINQPMKTPYADDQNAPLRSGLVYSTTNGEFYEIVDDVLKTILSEKEQDNMGKYVRNLSGKAKEEFLRSVYIELRWRGFSYYDLCG